MPRVDAISYAGNYLKKYYTDLVDEEPAAPDASVKKKRGKTGKSSTVDLTIDEETDSSLDESASGGSDTNITKSSDDE
jgi:hypothetical protein